MFVGRPDQKDSTGWDKGMFVEGVVLIARTRSPWPLLDGTADRRG